MDKIKIVYDINNFTEWVRNDNLFIERFEFIDIVKEDTQKTILIVNDKILKIKCILKVKQLNTMDDTVCIVYDLIKNNSCVHVEKIIDVIKNKTLCYVICEYIEGTNLAEYFTRNPSKIELIDIMQQLLLAIEHIHKYNIIHGDIKLTNIMINKQMHVYLIDFDLSKISNNELNISNCSFGTENYIAPEGFDLYIYSKKSDIWSLGICLYKLITGKFPYECQLNQKEHLYLRNNFKTLKLEALLEFVNVYNIHNIELITSMLEFREQNRPTINILLKKFENINQTVIHNII